METTGHQNQRELNSHSRNHTESKPADLSTNGLQQEFQMTDKGTRVSLHT